MPHPGALPGGVPPRAPSDTMSRFHRLEFGALGRYFAKQSPSFWLICTYLLFEYVRPQSIYQSMDILPWSQWSILACAAAVVLEGKLAKSFDAADAYLAMFTAVLLASSFQAFNPAVSFAALELYLTWVLIYVLITRSVDNEAKFFIFYCLFLLFSLKMSQHATRSWLGAGLRFRSWGATGAPGWFRNSGEMAIQMTIFIPLSMYLGLALKPHLAGLARRWKYWAVMLLPLTGVMALLASSSRGGQLGGVVVGIWMLMKSRQRVRGLVLGAAAGLIVFALLPAEQQSRFTEMGDDRTSQQRLTHWENGIEILGDNPVLGVGYANWYEYYAANGYLTGQGSQLSHNIFVQAGSELGYTGLAAFLALIFMTFRMNAQTRRRMKRLPDGKTLYYMAHGFDAALIGFMASGFFVTVLYYPYFWINYAMVAALFRVARQKARNAPAHGQPMSSGVVPSRTRPPRQFAGARSA